MAAVSCGLSCAMMWDGHGRWVTGQWTPYMEGDQNEQYRMRIETKIYWIYDGMLVPEKTSADLRRYNE